MHKLKKSLIKLTPTQRLYQLDIPLVGLTGSIATGKSTVSDYLREKGFFVIDADELVKSIYTTKESYHFIEQLCPESVNNHAIDFKILRNRFFSDAELKNDIEQFIYSHLPEQFNKRMQLFDPTQNDFVIYDVPLLFEKGLATKLDLNVVVYTRPNLQKDRLIQRDRLEETQASKIIQAQMSIEDKKQAAQFIIDNNGTQQNLKQEVDLFLSKILH